MAEHKWELDDEAPDGTVSRICRLDDDEDSFDAMEEVAIYLISESKRKDGHLRDIAVSLPFPPRDAPNSSFDCVVACDLSNEYIDSPGNWARLIGLFYIDTSTIGGHAIYDATPDIIDIDRQIPENGKPPLQLTMDNLAKLKQMYRAAHMDMSIGSYAEVAIKYANAVNRFMNPHVRWAFWQFMDDRLYGAIMKAHADKVAKADVSKAKLQHSLDKINEDNMLRKQVYGDKLNVKTPDMNNSDDMDDDEF